MRTKYYTIILASVFLLLSCGEEAKPQEPKEYIHRQAGFKIMAPAGWEKTDVDSEHFEFRSGSFKLIEVGGFSLELDPNAFQDFTNEEFMDLLRESTMEGFWGYCEDARIRNYEIIEKKDTGWDNLPAYRVTASGYSDIAQTDMVVDIIAIVYDSKSMIYMFASQIDKTEYQKTKPHLESTITSFKLLAD
jgi:hypothetical protein